MSSITIPTPTDPTSILEAISAMAELYRMMVPSASTASISLHPLESIPNNHEFARTGDTVHSIPHGVGIYGPSWAETSSGRHETRQNPSTILRGPACGNVQCCGATITELEGDRDARSASRKDSPNPSQTHYRKN